MQAAITPRVLKVEREARGRVSGDGVDLAFGFWPGRGLPVVVIHGLTASFVSYAGVAERVDGRRPLFGMDLRGRGDSDKPAGPYGMAQHGRDVAKAMQALGLGKSVIVGHSMGAFVATALATQNPELVRGIIMIDGGYVPDLPVGVEASQMLGAGSWRSMTEVLLPAAVPSIVAGLRISAGLGWQSLVGAELIVASSGVGYLMVKGQAAVSTATVMSGMIAIGVVGLLIDVALRRLQQVIETRRGL